MKNSTHYLLQAFSAIVLLVLAIVVAGHLNLYDQFRYIDKISHFIGGVIVAWFFSVYFKPTLGLFSKFNQIVILIACVCFVGVLWELAEYLSRSYSSEYFPTLYRYFRIGSLTDTVGDLVLDMLGGLSLGLIYITRKRQSP